MSVCLMFDTRHCASLVKLSITSDSCTETQCGVKRRLPKHRYIPWGGVGILFFFIPIFEAAELNTFNMDKLSKISLYIVEDH